MGLVERLECCTRLARTPSSVRAPCSTPAATYSLLASSARPSAMCRPCSRSYDWYAFRSRTVLAAMVWAARRARLFERRRGARVLAGVVAQWAARRAR